MAKSIKDQHAKQHLETHVKETQGGQKNWIDILWGNSNLGDDEKQPIRNAISQALRAKQSKGKNQTNQIEM